MLKFAVYVFTVLFYTYNNNDINRNNFFLDDT